jgi:hypothetical protein
VRAVIVAGEAWELPMAQLTLDTLAGHGAADEVLLPPELAGLRSAAAAPAQTPRIRVIGVPPGRFRCYNDIVTDLARRRPDARIVAAGSNSAADPDCVPVHQPPRPRCHAHRRIGDLDVWTVDSGEGYFPALVTVGIAPARPVWTVYGEGRPVFTRNTNDFAEPAPLAHDDYVILGSGLLGWRMVLESDPSAGARVLVYDINPDQLAWSRHVLCRAAVESDLVRLERDFDAAHPAARRRPPMPHEQDNADAQARWYAEHHRELGSLAGRLQVEHVLVDLLNTPAGLLDRLRLERSAFFMYLDLFTVWQVADRPPWICEFPGLARSLEGEVSRRCAAATFLPGPGLHTLQLAGSPFIHDRRGDPACT